MTVPEQRAVWRISGRDGFDLDGEIYSLPGEWETEDEAVAAAINRLIELDRLQPHAGGQSGIQDRVYVERPDGTRYRVMSILSKGPEDIGELRS